MSTFDFILAGVLILFSIQIVFLFTVIGRRQPPSPPNRQSAIDNRQEFSPTQAERAAQPSQAAMTETTDHRQSLAGRIGARRSGNFCRKAHIESTFNRVHEEL
jgi:hypothetical protein